MSHETVKRNRYYDPGPPEQTADHESKNFYEDFHDFHLPLERMHYSNLHDWGIASGLEVNGTLGDPEIKVNPGVAIDIDGHLISLSRHGYIGKKSPQGEDYEVPGGSNNESLVPVSLKIDDYKGKTVYVTIQFSQVLRSTEGVLGRLEQVPWVRLQPDTDTFDDRKSIVLAIAIIDSEGKLSELKTADSNHYRKLIGESIEELRIKKSSKTGDQVQDILSGKIGPGDAGGLKITVPDTQDSILFASEKDGNFSNFESIEIRANVGIGTPSPKEKLDVSGTIRLFGKNAFQGYDSFLRINQDNEFPGGTHFAHRANFGSGITTGSWWGIDPGVGNLLVQGSVGIGKINPDDKLDVNGNAYFGTGEINQNHKIVIRGPNVPNSSQSFQDLSYEFADAGSAKVRAFRGASWDTYLQFLTNPVTVGKDDPQARMQINGDGKVGIGTTNPERLLHVSSNDGQCLVLQSTKGSTGSTVSLDFQTYSTLNGRLSPTASLRAIDDGAYSSHLTFFTKQPGQDQNNLTERLRITSDGNIGIGTPTSKTKLDVQGDIRINDKDLWLRGGDDKNHGIGWYGGSSKLFANENLDGPAVFGCSGGALGTTCGGQKIALKWDSAGNVGIGTANPGEKLDVSGTIRLFGKNAFQGYDSFLRINQENAFPSGTHFAHRANFAAGITTGGWWDVEPGWGNLLAEGNVGIGTTSPGARLHVEATDKPTIMAQGCFGGLVSGSGGGHGIFGTNIYIDSNNQLKTAGRHDENYGYAGMHATWGNIRFYAADGNTAENGTIRPSLRLIISPNEIKHFVKCSQASSRELKKDVRDLSIKEAFKVLENLNPVTFVMKDDKEETLQVGFIAEEAPDLAATADRKGIVNNNIVAVLTKVIKEQQKTIKALIDDVNTLKINSGGVIS